MENPTNTSPIVHCILVINCGSSSVKYQLLNTNTGKAWIKGSVSGIGLTQGTHSYFWIDGVGVKHNQSLNLKNPAFTDCFSTIAELISKTQCLKLIAVGHRIVHGGEYFIQPTLINADVLDKIESLSLLAPLHNLANARGIHVCQDLFPNIRQVAVFDTAFHQTMPAHAYRYALPDSWYSEHKIRKYGFHGNSHQYVANKAAEYLQRPLENINLITLHLGNGASVAAIQKGKCIDTSMGFTPLEGLIMGTRSGDIDPAIPLYMQQTTRNSATQMGIELNDHSGLFAITGEQDMRNILVRSKDGDLDCKLAIDMYCYRVKKYIGAYFAALGEVDAIVFTGGIGENAVTIRSLCCKNLYKLGIAIDEDLNSQHLVHVLAISPANSSTCVLVIETNEELQIANAVEHLINNDCSY